MFAPLRPMPDQKTKRTRCLGVFSVMWAPIVLLSPVKIRMFCPNLAQNWHFWSIWARPCRLIQCPAGGSVGGCGARAVSCKTPIYFIIRGEIMAKHSRSDPTDFKDSRKRKWVGGPAQLWAGKALTSPSVAPQDRIPGPQLPPVITPQRTFSKSKYDLK